MKLKDLIGLHKLRSVGMWIDHEAGDIVTAIEFDLDGVLYRAERQELPEGQSCMKLTVERESYRSHEEDIPGVPVFCIHRELWGEFVHNLPSDILEIYDAKTAREVLIIGTEDFCEQRCWLSYFPQNLTKK